MSIIHLHRSTLQPLLTRRILNEQSCSPPDAWRIIIIYLYAAAAAAAADDDDDDDEKKKEEEEEEEALSHKAGPAT